MYIVGAGPGDPELITVRGRRLLRRSDVVVYDRLVHPALLDEPSVSVERIFVGKGAGHGTPQAEINALLIDRARRGLRVARLKGGDPFVFGRGAEEAEALRAAGVPFEIVPGISSAIGVPAYAGIPVTHRRLGSAFAVVTGHECAGASDLDWGALARIPVVVVLMAHRTLSRIARQLMAGGAPPSTPAAVVNRGATPQQRVVTGTLSHIAAAAAAASLEPPSVLIVGETVPLAEILGWYPSFATDAGASKESCSRIGTGRRARRNPARSRASSTVSVTERR